MNQADALMLSSIGTNALHEACKFGRLQIVSYLLEHAGYNVN